MYFSLLYLKLFILQNDGITFICILRTICINIILCTGCIIIKMITHNLLNTLSVSLIDGKILSIKLEFYKHVFQNKNPNKQMLITTLSTKPWNYPDYTMMRTSHIDNHWVRIRIKIPYLLKIPEKIQELPRIHGEQLRSTDNAHPLLPIYHQTETIRSICALLPNCQIKSYSPCTHHRTKLQIHSAISPRCRINLIMMHTGV